MLVIKYYSVSVAEQKWNSTSNRLIGLNRLFRNKEEEATAFRKENSFEPQVRVYLILSFKILSPFLCTVNHNCNIFLKN